MIPPVPNSPDVWRAVRITLLSAAAVAGLLLIWTYWEDIEAFTQDAAGIQGLAEQLGWMGPAGLIAINVLQMVIAPIPGYAVYLVAGFLYGAVWGGIWGSLGLLMGGMLSMWLARRFGRPLVMCMVGREHMENWEAIIHSDSLLVWGMILLSPIGDTPYYLAGLSKVGFMRIAVLSVLTRVPQAFLAAALGDGAFQLNSWHLLSLFAILFVPVLLFVRYRDQFFRWLRRNSSPIRTGRP